MFLVCDAWPRWAIEEACRRSLSVTTRTDTEIQEMIDWRAAQKDREYHAYALDLLHAEAQRRKAAPEDGPREEPAIII